MANGALWSVAPVTFAKRINPRKRARSPSDLQSQSDVSACTVLDSPPEGAQLTREPATGTP